MYAKPFFKRAASKLLMLSMMASLALLNVDCKKRRFPNPPATTYVSREMILDNFLDNCYTTVNGTEHIPYRGTVLIQYLDNNTRQLETLKSFDFTSPNTAQKQPISIPVMVPETGPFWVKVDIQGQQCARCASGRGGTSDDTRDNCPERPVTGGLQVAIPHWIADFKVETTTGPISVNNIQHGFNVAHSCGCVVPD